ncbi:hypothetical protein [Paenibacillus koleovorans]|uniref:hypothetical protein n=1 Tax=Paenibacillus koleovorans TaxID=121608 RepID=UPI000FD89788|nr:hypothetical protein [Paenibacillus koleovorans]
MKFKRIEIEWPEFGGGEAISYASIDEYEERITRAKERMKEHGLTHLVVYADREHFANVTYLAGLDPRFEEALLIVARTGTPLLLVGVECVGYLPISPLYRAGRLRTECYPTFSLMNISRQGGRKLSEIFSEEGIGSDSRIGCAGWKYYSEEEHPGGAHALDCPSYIADTLRSLAGYENVTNAAALFIDPDRGLRTSCSAAEIAYFEYTNVLASEGMKRVLLGIREGMTDHELLKRAEYSGEPLGSHMTLKAGGNRIGLSSARGEIVTRGLPLSSNICYWGSNICRVGWVAESADDLPEEARGYIDDFAGPFYEAMGEWLGLLQVGARAGDFVQLVGDRLPAERFGIKLNPGHLIHLDEWISSPFYPASDIRLRSGMVIQLDVIPKSPVYGSTRMEEGYVLADSALQTELGERFPAMYARCLKRRYFMREMLGIRLHEDVLPLSNIPGIVVPFLLEPRSIFALSEQ